MRQLQSFFSRFPPLSAKGRFALARALLASGDRKDAEALVREAWRNDSFSQDVESRVTDTFGEFLTRADHKARMDRRLYEKDDTDAGLRAAERLGGNELLIAKARIACWPRAATRPRSTRCRLRPAMTSATSSPASSCCGAPTRPTKRSR